MPSTSPGIPSSSPPADFIQILPGAPTCSLQALTTFTFRHKRYVVYFSGCQLNICTSPTKLVQALSFDDELKAIAAESQTGKIAVVGKSDRYILEPVAEGWTRVWWKKSLRLGREDAGDEAQCLSWSGEGDLLVGGTRQLSLLSTLPSSRTNSPAVSPADVDDLEERSALWSKPIASPVQFAVFCPSANLIATNGRYDRLVKIWRRLSFEEALFDYTYLPHPGAVTHIEWRLLYEHSNERRGSGISGRHDENPEVLYTIANDGLLRIWKTCGMHEPDIVVLHTSIDLVSAIPQSPSLATNGTSTNQRPPRYAFTIPAEHFDTAVTAAVASATGSKTSHALEHLKEVSSKSLDIIVTLDGHDRMSAWGVQSIGHKRRPQTPSSTQPFHIAHVEDLPLKIKPGSNARFQTWFVETTLHILVHTFDGHVMWWQGDVEAFFSPSAPGRERLAINGDWCGHMQNIVGMRAARDGTNVVSWTAGGDLILWKRASDVTLMQESRIETGERMFDALVWDQRGQQVVTTVHAQTTANWSAEGRNLSSEPLASGSGESQHMLLPTDGQLSVIEALNRSVADPTTLKGASGSNEADHATERCDLDSPESKLTCHATSTARGHLFVTADGNGVLSRYTLQSTEPDRGLVRIDGSEAAFPTGVTEPSCLEANEVFAALLSSDGKELTVVDLKDGYIEHTQTFTERVRRVRWHETSEGQNLLAVSLKTSVEVLGQARYDHRKDHSAWITVYQVSIAGTGLDIFAIAWLHGANLAIAGSNGIMICGSMIATPGLDEEAGDRLDLRSGPVLRIALPELAWRLNQPLPVWHPETLSHFVGHGNPGAAIRVLHRLNEKLKYWSEGDDLHAQLDIDQDQLLVSDRDAALSTEVIQELAEHLEEKNLPAISTAEQGRLKLVVQALAFICEHLEGLDLYALRYLFSWKVQLLHLAQAAETQAPDGTKTNGVHHSAQQPPVPQMHWREIAFATHSTTQQPLVDILIPHYDNKLTWPIASALGLTAWLSDPEALASIFESLAQSSYRQTSPPDPINASLFFLALHKKQTLLGLWRIATGHKEQRATVNFLKRDFALQECKVAAKKNAYALMGKRRFKYAAAFFLLADDAASAVSLLAGQCGDAMLAIAVARLYSGDGSDVLRKLLEERLMVSAEKDGDRWLMSWCHSTLGEKREAADALVRPLKGIRKWWQDDPATLVLYRQLRKVPSEHEYQAVLRAARLLRRMGMWVLAVDVVSKWAFVTADTHHPPVQVVDGSEANGIHDETTSVLDGFGAPEEPLALPVETESPTPPVLDEKAAREAKAAELLAKLKAKKETASPAPAVASETKAQPTQFKEPDPGSLLDSFGF
ncbi:regulator of (H+)-ATPase in vacuolar membrane [Friedmanniomyces endolithicus]|uniref:Regulator of (H+)-ATPase in vacuolar membrane n=1 Tax=Friedmanniomyces endolithicus TaxID=329885 RepID=A0AAN6G0V6_9PEZI|nr:regulator of (H+)-ATPase in vacuolar membrane [Friedmanniomyces endolithicus]